MDETKGTSNSTTETKSTSKLDNLSRVVTKDGVCMVQQFWDIADQVKELDVKPDDVWILTFPKSGTTWMQEAVWLLTHNLDFEGAKVLLKYRSPTLEACWSVAWTNRPSLSLSEFERFASLSGGRRVLKTHIHWKHLPQKLQNPDAPAKIIYVYRNPKDVCVSYYYFFHFSNERFRNAGVTMEDFVDWFMADVTLGRYWVHLKGYWTQRNNPNILIVKYEDMKKDLAAVIKKVATFLGVPVPEGEQMDTLLNHLSFESMRKNPGVNRQEDRPDLTPNDAESSDKGNFIRKGIVGDWKRKLTPEMIEKLDKWIQENRQDIDWTFEDSIQNTP